MVTAVWRDLVLAARSLMKARAFTVVCVISLGIGMAPVIAVTYGARVFSAPPAGVRTAGLVELVTTATGPRQATDKWSYPDFLDLRDANTGVSLTGWAQSESEVRLPDGGEMTTADTLFVDAKYFSVIDLQLARGPGFSGSAEPTVILAHGFWQRRLNGDANVVGKIITIGGTPHTVVGVTPEHFRGHFSFQDEDLFLPLERHPMLRAEAGPRFDRGKEWLSVLGRLAPGTAMSQASAAVSALTTQLSTQYPATNEGRVGAVADYHPIGSLEGSVLTVIRSVWQAMALLPLLVVCLNISGMVQVRSAMRERELSIRQAIGASRRRLMQHLLAEAVVLAVLGGALASIVIFNIPALMSWWAGEPIPLSFRNALRLDASMLAVCAGLCLGTSLIFGWLPATRFSRPVILTVLKDEAGTGGVRVGRVQRVAAALQVAIAVPLLVLSGMSLDRVRATATSDLGFAADVLYAAPLTLDRNAEGSPEFRLRTIRDNLAQTPGVASVTVADGLPLDFRYRMATISHAPDPNTAPTTLLVHATRVGDGYLDTMGIPLLRGRSFSSEDAAGGDPVALISKALADRLFDGVEGGGIGQRLTFGTPGDSVKPARTLMVVGVTADFPTSQMSTEREQVLLPLAQHADLQRDGVPVEDDRSNAPAVMIVARSAPGESPARMTAALENAIRPTDPDFRPERIVTGASLRAFSMSDFLTQSAVAGCSGGVILLLSALGIYGVIGMMVSTRTREIAVRMALGASRPRVIGLIVLDVIKLVSPGVVVGLVIATALVRLNGGILGVSLSNMEPLAYVAGATVVMLIAILASLAPARRAASVQPMAAMRST